MKNIEQYKAYRATTTNPMSYPTWMSHQTIVNKSKSAKIKEV